MVMKIFTPVRRHPHIDSTPLGFSQTINTDMLYTYTGNHQIDAVKRRYYIGLMTRKAWTKFGTKM